ncbi:MAG: chromosome partitioning protein [Chloroflexales bacterium]|nr:chromosome partitioning protein [Chloroflexales bacterium]
MKTVLFTGPVGITALAAAATAAAAAAGGSRVLLASVGPSHPVAAIAGIQPPAAPQPLAAGLDLWCLDPLADMNSLWGAIWPSSSAPITGDELPVIPGIDLFLAIAHLRGLPSYDLVCVDGGPPEALLRALGIPDAFRCLVRLLIGLDRGPGRSSTSIARAIIPTGLLPMPLEWLGWVQDARVHLERLRDEVIAPASMQVRYVFSPDRGSLADAQLNLPTLQLFGLAVESLVAGPLLPPAPGLEALAAEQAATISQAGAIFHGRPVYGLEAVATPDGLETLTRLGLRLYGADSPLPGPPLNPPVTVGGLPEPYITLDLPGLPREALGLTLSGDELIVRAGPYRRHLLMPEGLRGITAIKASRQGEKLIIRPRK